MEIKVSVEDLSPVNKKLTLEVPAEEVSRELESISQAWRKEARLPGFRKGRAPLGLVKQAYRQEIRQELIQSLVPRTFGEAVRQQGWNPVGDPQIADIDLGGGGPLRYTARLEVLPEVKLPAYEGLQLEDVELSVSDQEVATNLQQMRDRAGRWEPVEDRPIQEGDVAVVDLRGEYLAAVQDDDQQEDLPDPIREEDVEVQVGGENTHEAFTRNLIGMSIAEEKTFDVSYPADYSEARLAGRRVRFTVEVGDVRRRVLPELDDEFARSLGDFESLEQLQARLREDLRRQKERDRDNRLRNQLLGKLVEQTGFEIPESLVQERIDHKIRDVAYNMVSRGVDIARAGLDWTRLRGELRQRAEKELRGELILDQIAQEQQIKVEREDEDEELARAAESMDRPLSQLRSHYLAEERREAFRLGVRRRKTLDWLMERAVVGE